MVASCKLPLGMPSLSLLATGFLFLVVLVGRAHRQRFGKTADRALMAHQSIALYLHAKQQRVVVAIGSGADDAQPVAAGFALHPQLLAGAAPEGDKAALQRFGIADGVEKAQHQHLARARILHDSGHEAIHLVKVDCRCRIAHAFPCLDFSVLVWSVCPSVKKPAGLSRRRALGVSLDLSGRLVQAMAVRRHGGSMMVMMTVMAVALHLIKTIIANRHRCQR